MLVDTHAHLDYIVRAGNNAEDVLKRMAEQHIGWMVNPTTHPDYYADVIALAEKYDNVFVGLSVHPTDVQETDEEAVFTQIESLLSHPKVVAIGETGLDYYHDTAYIEQQQRYFRRFLQLALTHKLPVIVHCRDANDNNQCSLDTENIIGEFPGVTGVMHCFGGTPDFAQRMVAKGFYISFAGNVTFKKAFNLHESAQQVPLDKILVETDSPFLSPEPYRGQPNEPCRTFNVAERVAALRNISFEALAMATTQNAHRLFNVPVAAAC